MTILDWIAAIVLLAVISHQLGGIYRTNKQTGKQLSAIHRVLQEIRDGRNS